MSGPKVVRIVTREEILELCHGLLARVDAAIDDWARTGRRNDCVDDDAIAFARKRRDDLAAMIAADRFMELQKQAPIEEEFLRADIQQRLAKVADRRAAERSKERREREAAAILLKTLHSSGVALDADLQVGLERGDPAATGHALLLLGGRPTAGADAALAAKLGEGAATASLGEWLSRQPAPPLDPAVDRIERRIAEILQIGDARHETAWRGQLHEANLASTARRNLLIDALEVDTGRALTAARRHAAASAELRGAVAEAMSSGLDASVWLSEIEAADPAELESRRHDVIAALEAQRSARAVQARRAAVLEGLGGLGYEITEGMSTVWASQGRLVLKNAARPDYGVELSGDRRVQMRPVAFVAGGRGPDPSRDRDAETFWCGDVARLGEHLAAMDGSLEIERSTPVGATALKRIEIVSDDAARAGSLPASRQRTLP